MLRAAPAGAARALDRDPEPEPAPEPEGAGPLARLRARLAAASPVPLEGRSVSLAIDELGRLLDLAEMCATGFAVGMVLDAKRDDRVLAAAGASRSVDLTVQPREE